MPRFSAAMIPVRPTILIAGIVPAACRSDAIQIPGPLPVALHIIPPSGTFNVRADAVYGNVRRG
jgi:hypothetical protein